MKQKSDSFYMRRALTLAARAFGITSPNPVVGAVIVSPEGEKIGEGYHHGAGQAHAEIEAIRNAGPRLRPGCTIYVTLEPCCTTGRTPPCTEALIRERFARVVVGCTDPNPKHSGRGFALLREAGIEVCSGVLEEACREINEPFFHWITEHRPLVLLKMASTLDGKTATPSGDSRWVTGPKARARVQQLRKQSEAVLVGASTFRLDHPALTVRTAGGKVLRTPLRFVASSDPLLVLPPGWEKVALPDRQAWTDFLAELGSREHPVMQLLLEGGSELAASALNAGIVDEIEFHYAPKILGGRSSRGVVGGEDPLRMADALPVRVTRILRAGPDLIVRGTLR